SRSICGIHAGFPPAVEVHIPDRYERPRGQDMGYRFHSVEHRLSIGQRRSPARGPRAEPAVRPNRRRWRQDAAVQLEWRLGLGLRLWDRHRDSAPRLYTPAEWER